MTYKIVIEAWPFHTGKLATKAQADVAPRVREWHIDAQDFDAAVTAAKHIQLGVASHDKVWQAKIRTVTEWPMPLASRG